MERLICKRFQGLSPIRQLLDEIKEPNCLVLKYLDNNLLDASNKKKLEKSDIKSVAKKVLEALATFHEASYVHTGISSPLLDVHSRS
jgi:casein kinase II subunit alpha